MTSVFVSADIGLGSSSILSTTTNRPFLTPALTTVPTGLLAVLNTALTGWGRGRGRVLEWDESDESESESESVSELDEPDEPEPESEPVPVPGARTSIGPVTLGRSGASSGRNEQS